MPDMNRYMWLIALLVSSLSLVGCGKTQPKGDGQGPPEVVVTYPVIQEVTDFEDFTGRTDAVRTVAVRARVQGYLDKFYFKEGTEVSKGTDIGPAHVVIQGLGRRQLRQPACRRVRCY